MAHDLEGLEKLPNMGPWLKETAVVFVLHLRQEGELSLNPEAFQGLRG
tara:strand:+ start:104 stop:247 length:144 start_codon:yes stop_codon:yes gene_type:complete